MAGGARGGSGQYVYSLGRRGFYQYFEGGYSAARSVNYHTLAIVDCFVTLRRLEREGAFKVLAMSTEPDCWAVIGGVELKPDLYVELERGTGRLLWWLEVDMGTESQKQLQGKLEAVVRAYRDYDEADALKWPTLPRTLWVGVDEERAKELAWLVGRLPAEAQRLFAVTSKEHLAQVFT
jgi:hypothetical protein